jgi:hypothetical protein
MIKVYENMRLSKWEATYHILLLPCYLTGRLEVDPEYDLAPFLGLGHILDCGDMERDGRSVNGENDRLLGLIDVDLEDEHCGVRLRFQDGLKKWKNGGGANKDGQESTIKRYESYRREEQLPREVEQRRVSGNRRRTPQCSSSRSTSMRPSSLDSRLLTVLVGAPSILPLLQPVLLLLRVQTLLVLFALRGDAFGTS